MPLAVTNYDFSLFLQVTGATFSESVMFPAATSGSAPRSPS